MASLAEDRDGPSGPLDPAAGAGTGLFARHGKALLEILTVSALGIVATAGFQVVTTRGLGPQAFGLLASFLALLNIAAIGSAALRNAVAVNVATPATPSDGAPRRLDSSLVEALALGGACGIGVLLAAPLMASSVQSSVVAPVLAAVTMVPYFLFARSLGFLQGRRRTRAVVWWSTGSQLAQLALTGLVLWMGLGVVGVLLAHLVMIVAVTVGSTIQTRTMSLSVQSPPFSPTSTVVLLLTISFAWLTNVDVILVRSGAPELAVGTYAAAAVLVKTSLILPATLSLYLLPRFVGTRSDAALSRLGVNLSLAVAGIGGLAILGAFAVAGKPIVSVLFGPGYGDAAALLPWMALTWIPWAMTQAILVRITAVASRSGLAVLLCAMVVQWVGAKAVLPNVTQMIWLNGAVGTTTLVLLFLIHARAARRSAMTAEGGVAR